MRPRTVLRTENCTFYTFLRVAVKLQVSTETVNKTKKQFGDDGTE